MKLENQVCTIIQGKRLKELGVNAPSYFSWFGDESKHNLTDNKGGVTLDAWLYVASTEPINNQQVELRENTEQVNPLAPAYNVAEIGVAISGCEMAETTVWDDKKHTWGIRGEAVSPEYEYEAHCRTDLLIYCLENCLTTPEEVNQRLNNA